LLRKRNNVVYSNKGNIPIITINIEVSVNEDK